MRRGGPPKQRLWLGAGRYCSDRRDAGTNAKRFAHSCIHRYSLRCYDTNSDGNANCNSNGYCYPNRDGDCYGNSYSFGHADSDAYAEACADAKSSSHSGAETIEIFANAKISSVPRRSDARRRVACDRCCLGRLAQSDARHLQTQTRNYLVGRAVLCTPIFSK